MGRLDGKVAFITGGARGQGLEAAQLFASEGARVVLGDLLDAEGKEAADSIGENAHFVHLDVTNEEDWRVALDETVQRFGDVSVLLNMAGILKFGKIADQPLAEYMSVINVNQVGVFLGMRAVFESMKRAGGGSIINVSSVEGLRGSVGLAAYTASKFAVRGMTKVAAGEFGKHAIRVNSIHPGVIDTPMVASDDTTITDRIVRATPLRRVGEPVEIARVALFLASDEASYMTGAHVPVDGGVTA